MTHTIMNIPENLDVAKLFEKQIKLYLRADALYRTVNALRDMRELGVKLPEEQIQQLLNEVKEK